jgi:hypothetical protein
MAGYISDIQILSKAIRILLETHLVSRNIRQPKNKTNTGINSLAFWSIIKKNLNGIIRAKYSGQKKIKKQLVVFVINPYFNRSLRPNEWGGIKPKKYNDFEFDVMRGFFNYIARI